MTNSFKKDSVLTVSMESCLCLNSHPHQVWGGAWVHLAKRGGRRSWASSRRHWIAVRLYQHSLREARDGGRGRAEPTEAWSHHGKLTI
jgi:hypothetical protein